MSVFDMSELDKVRGLTSGFAYGVPEKYRLLDDAYEGRGGFEDSTYLIHHPREPIEKYVSRQMMAYYCNYVKPVVDAHVNPIFKTLPRRTYNSNKLFDGFIEDVDGQGTSMNRFMKKAALRSKLHGVEFVVIDNSQIEGTITLADAVSNRIYPYLYLVSPRDVITYNLDKYGNMELIKYRLSYTEVDDNGNISYNTETWTWTKAKWFRSNKDGDSNGINKLGVVPVVPILGARTESDSLLPQSDIYPIARTNLAIFNACSELRERNRNQAFSLLTYPVEEANDYDPEDTQTVGTADMLVYKSTTANRPEYISPAAEPSQMLSDEITWMVQEIYRMANLQVVTGVQTQTSGIAKEWDNQQLFQTIAEFSRNLESVEVRIASIFEKYTSSTLDFAVDYNNSFGITDPTETLNIATQALTLDMGPMFNIQMKQKVARDTLKDLDDQVLAKVVEDVANYKNAGDPTNTDPTVLSYPNK